MICINECSIISNLFSFCVNGTIRKQWQNDDIGTKFKSDAEECKQLLKYSSIRTCERRV